MLAGLRRSLASVGAQTPLTVETEPESQSQASPSNQVTPPVTSNRRPGCDGCPPRRLGRSLLVATVVNGFYEMANLIRGQDTARITPETWWTNMKRGRSEEHTSELQSLRHLV